MSESARETTQSRDGSPATQKNEKVGGAPNESLICESCGRFGAFEFGDRKLCLDCYAGSGSCCPEFGRKECDSGNS